MNSSPIRVAGIGIVAAAAVAILTTSPALATPVTLLVDDHADAPLNVHLLGTVVNSSVQVTQEGIGVLGGVDAHFEYVSSDPNVPGPGNSITYNFNIYEDAALTELSDTWSITISGHTPTGPDDANVSVDTHFRSDSLDDIQPSALAGGILSSITEDRFLPAPSGLPDGTYQYVGPLLTDLTTGFNSAVPEPVSIALLGAGLAGLAAIRRRR